MNETATRPGQIVRLTNRSVFKIGLVIGPSKVPGKIRVCPWQNASRSWSEPQAESTAHVERITVPTPREYTVVRRAAKQAAKQVEERGEVAWSGGAIALKKVTL